MRSNYFKRRNTHKRLYNSVKHSLEKRSQEKTNNILKSDYSKAKDSLDKENDIQNIKKGIQKKQFIHKLTKKI